MQSVDSDGSYGNSPSQIIAGLHRSGHASFKGLSGAEYTSLSMYILL